MGWEGDQLGRELLTELGGGLASILEWSSPSVNPCRGPEHVSVQ